MDVFNFSPDIYLGFLLTFIRISLILFMLPVFDVEGLPAPWKAAMCMILTLALFPSIGLSAAHLPAHPFALADPLSGNNTGLVAHFLYMVATLTFLALDGHLYLLKAFAGTFQIVPPGGLTIRGVLLPEIIRLSSMVFTFGVRIAAPVMAALFLTEVALGLLARTAPQMHIMDIGFPLKIAVGFFFVGLLFVIISNESRSFIDGIAPMFHNLLKVMAPAS